MRNGQESHVYYIITIDQSQISDSKIAFKGKIATAFTLKNKDLWVLIERINYGVLGTSHKNTRNL